MSEIGENYDKYILAVIITGSYLCSNLILYYILYYIIKWILGNSVYGLNSSNSMAVPCEQVTEVSKNISVKFSHTRIEYVCLLESPLHVETAVVVIMGQII
jgi:hypothetical protein